MDGLEIYQKKILVANKSDDWFSESFRFVLPGYNVRPVEMSGAIGIEQLKKLPMFLKHRRKMLNYFVSIFKIILILSCKKKSEVALGLVFH